MKLAVHKKIFRTFKFCTKVAWVLKNGVKVSYDSAILKLKEIEPFEADLRQTDKPKEKAEIWRKYIDYELKKADPVRIEFVYERATTQLCLDPALWVKYLNWARKIKSPNLTKIAKRATRNCSWEGELWILRLKIQEEKSCSKSEIGKVVFRLASMKQNFNFASWWRYISGRKCYFYTLTTEIAPPGGGVQKSSYNSFGVKWCRPIANRRLAYRGRL